MDWANVTKIRTPSSAKRYSPPPPTPLDEHAPYKDNTRPGQECILAPRGRAPFGADQKEPEEILRMPKVIADIAHR